MKLLRSVLTRHTTLPVLVTAMCAATVVGVLFSPAALSWIGNQRQYDWPQLSTIGQTYGATSAVLAGLALLGIVASLYFQASEAKASREQALRALHTDLLRMALDEPAFLECWGPVGEASDVTWTRKHIYANLIVSHWQLMWEVDVLSEVHLRVLTEQFFKGSVGRRYWSEAREPRLKAETSRRARRFTRIVDAQYFASVAGGPALDEPASPQQVEPPPVPEPPPASRSSTKAALVAVAAVACGVALGHRLANRRPR